MKITNLFKNVDGNSTFFRTLSSSKGVPKLKKGFYGGVGLGYTYLHNHDHDDSDDDSGGESSDGGGDGGGGE